MCTYLKVNKQLFFADNPKFSSPIANVTVAVGREALIECGVDNLSTFKVCKLLSNLVSLVYGRF